MATEVPSYTPDSENCQQFGHPPRAGIGPQLRLPATPSPHPKLADAVQEWCRGHSPAPGKPNRWGQPVGGDGIRTRCPHCGGYAAAAYWKPDYQQPTVVCPSCSPFGRPIKSNSGYQLRGDVGKLLGELQGGQFFSLKALRQHSHENYATMPQECQKGHPPNGPCPHGHAWPLWGVYAIARIIQDCYPDFEIRTTGRVYNDQGDVIFHDRQVVVRKDAPSPRTWQLSHCMDDEINEILTPAQTQFSAVYRKHLDQVGGGLALGREGLVVLVSGMTESVTDSVENFCDETRYQQAHPRLFQHGVEAKDDWFGPRTPSGVPKWTLPRPPTPSERNAMTELLQARASPVPPTPAVDVRPVVAKVAKDLGITVEAARVMVADAERRARDREAEWARRRYRVNLNHPPEILETE